MNFRFSLLALMLSCAAVQAACPDDAAVAAYVDDFNKRKISKGFGNDLSLADAECAKRKLGEKLKVALGELVGYKAAFTNPALQERFGVSGPKWGYMYDRNMVDIVAILPADFGARPLYEADFIVEVNDPRLADAATPLEALSYLEGIVPFIELPDHARRTIQWHSDDCDQCRFPWWCAGYGNPGREKSGLSRRIGEHDSDIDR